MVTKLDRMMHFMVKMPLLKTRADFINALPLKFPNIDKTYKIRFEDDLVVACY